MLNDQEVKERTDITMKMSNVTGESTDKVSSYMTAIWNNFADGSDNLERFADIITRLGADTASSSEEIAEGLEKFAAVGNTVGLSYEYATSALATVVAQTRQTPDVVGTAFKTLFARIQDLELGSTLDDGTTLGTYSQALEKVGINIKDTSGQLKDMDAILEEMGSKWQTLGKDQQVALAQNVAGTRQYTQLVALMDNWDFFQENLKDAQNAEGSLQEQADIYAESWEGARKRVKASAQAIYSDLIDDKAFIKGTNAVADFLDGLDKVIDATGGLRTILLGLGAIGTTVFQKNMAKGLENTKYAVSNLSVALKNLRNDTDKNFLQKIFSIPTEYKNSSSKALIEEINATSKQTIEKYKKTAKFAPDSEDTYFFTRLETQQDQFILEEEINAISKNITNSKREELLVEKDIVKTLGERKDEQIAISKQAKENAITAKQELDDEFLDNITMTTQGRGYTTITKGATFGSNQKAQAIQDAKAIFGDDIKILTKGNRIFAQGGFDAIDKTREQLISDTRVLLKLQEEINKLQSDENLTEKQQNNLIKEQIKMANEQIQIEAIKVDEKRKSGAAINASLSKTRNAGKIINSSNIVGVAESQNIAEVEKNRSVEYIGIYDKKISELAEKIKSVPQVPDLSVGLSQMISGATQATMAFSMLSQTMDNWSDKDMSGFEKISSTIGNLVFSLPMLISGLSPFIKNLSSLSKLTELLNTIGILKTGMNEISVLEENFLNITGQVTDSKTKQNVLDEISQTLEEKKLSSEAKSIILEEAENQLNADETVQLTQQNILEATKNKLKAAGNALSLSSIAAIGLIIAALATVITIITKIHQKQVEVREEAATTAYEALDSYEDLTSTLKDNTEALKQNQTAIEENQEAYKQAKVNGENYSDVLNTLNENYDDVVENAKEYAENLQSVGEENSELKNKFVALSDEIDSAAEKLQNTTAIDERTKAYQELINKVQEATIAENEAGIRKAEKAISKGEATFSDDMVSGRGREKAGKYILQLPTDLYKNSQSKITQELQKLVKEDKSLSVGNYYSWQDGKTTGQIVGEDLFEVYSSLKKVQEQLEEDFTEEELEENENYKELNEWLEKSKDSYEKLLEAKQKYYTYTAENLVINAAKSDTSKINTGSVKEDEISFGDLKVIYASGKNKGEQVNSQYTLADYRLEREALIKSVAGDDVKEGTKAWEEAAAAVDKYIEKYGDAKTQALQTEDEVISSAVSALKDTDIDLLDKKQQQAGLSKERVLAGYYDSLSEAEKEAFSSLDFSNIKISEDSSGLEAISKEIANATRTSFQDQLDEEQKEIQTAAELDTENLATYTEQLEKNLKLSEEWAGMEADIASANMLLNIGINDLNETFEAYSKTLELGLKKGNKAIQNTEDYAVALKDLKKGFSEMLNISEEYTSSEYMSEDFWFKNYDNIKKAAAGNADAIEELSKATGEELITHFSDSVNTDSEEFTQWLQLPENAGKTVDDYRNIMLAGIQAVQDELSSSELKMGEVDDEDFIESINAMLAAAGDSAPLIANALKAFGFDTKYTSVSQEVDQTISVPQVRYKVNADLENGITITPETTEVKPTTYTSQVQIPSVKAITYNGNFGGNINASTNKTKNKTGSKKSGSGNKKSPSTKTFKNDFNSSIERYHTIDRKIAKTTKEYEQLADAKDRAYGTNRLKTIDKEIAKIKKQISLEEKKLKQAQKYVKKDKKALVDAAAEAGTDIDFGSNGEITNYQKALKKAEKEVKKAYDTKDDDKIEEAEKKYDNLVEAITQYEESLDTVTEQKETILELTQQIADEELEKITYKVDLKLEVNERDLKLIQYKLKQWERSNLSGYYDSNYVDQQLKVLSNYQSNYNTNKQAINNILGAAKVGTGKKARSLTQAEINSVINGTADEDFLESLNLTSDQVTALQEASDGMLEAAENIADTQDEIYQIFSNNMEQYKDDFEQQMSILEHQKNMVSSLQEIFILANKDETELMNKMREALIASSETQGLAYRQNMENAVTQMNLLNDRLSQEISDAERKALEENLEEWQNYYRENEENMLSSVQDALDAIKEKLEANIEEIKKLYEEALSGGYGTFSNLELSYDMDDEVRDTYVPAYEKIYNLSKLTQDIQKSMDDTDSIKGKQKLLALQKKINAAMEDNVELTEYDLDRLEAEYQLELAKIALEEAQNAKNTVRMQRDNLGNWSYVYTADEDKVADAMAKYEETIYNLRKLDDERDQELERSIVDINTKYFERLQQIMEMDDGEAKDNALAQLKNWYDAMLSATLSYAETVSKNEKELYETEAEYYEATTGRKIDALGKWITSFSETSVMIKSGYSSMDEALDGYKNVVDKYTDEVVNEYVKSQNEANNVMAKFGIDADYATNSIDNLNNSLTTTIDKIKELGDNLAKITQEDLDKMNYISEYDSTVENATTEVGKMNESFATLAGVAGAASGGYTGDWQDTNGKLMFVHQKELILNKDETQALFDLSDLLKKISLPNLLTPTIEFTNLNQKQDKLEQSVTIKAEFPNVTEHNEIEMAIDNLINRASQYANRTY